MARTVNYPKRAEKIKEMIDEGKIIDQDMFQSPPSSNESLND